MVVMICVIVIIMVVMICVIVIIMLIVMICMIVIIMLIAMIIMGVNLAIKVLSFSPDQRWAYSRLNRETGSMTQSPLKNTSEQTIQGVMLRTPLQIGVKTTVTLNSDHRSEVELTSFKRFIPTTTMGAVSQSLRSLNEWNEK